MNALLVLMGLLVLAYIGSFLFGGHSVRGLGLPSGVEFLAAGFLLGPHALGVIERSMLDTFEPIAHVALGWIALVTGAQLGLAGGRRVRPAGFALGLFSALLSGAIVTGAVLLFLRRFPLVPPGVQSWLLAGGLGTACAETTRDALRWVFEKHQARGPLSDLLADVAHADDAVPLVALAVLFALAPAQAHVPWTIPMAGWLGATVGLGVVLGATAALLLGREFREHTTWGVVFGAALLGLGTATRLSLSPMTVTFFMGIAMAWVSPHRDQVRDLLAPTERPVLLPALVLAGANVDLNVMPQKRLLFGVVAVALGARVLSKLLAGALVRASPAARGAGAGVGLALASAGPLAITCGLALSIRFPGQVGDTALVGAALTAVLGEFVAPSALKRALADAGELGEPASNPSPPTSDLEQEP